MLISKKWLQTYIDVSDLSDAKLDTLWSLSGTSVESIENPWEGIEKIYAGRIVEIEDHPNADRLIVCKVDTGHETKTIVTGDRSLNVNDTVPVAVVGATIKGGFKIKKAKLRGVKSEGMMCSLEELNLEEKSEHVYRFNEPLEPGTDILEYFGLNDSVFDLEVTANRPDELSFIGVAREVHSLTKGEKELKKIDTDYNEGDKETTDLIDIEIDTPENCFRYASLVIDDVRVGESPEWLKRDLKAIGLRPINNVVDVTNYVLMETGHPIHAFDLDKLNNPGIKVRLAKKDEKLLLLNDEEITCSGDEMLITDGENPLALAGIMGGKGTGVTRKTKRVLLEVATFDPVKIRRTARKFNLSSDSSYRFERGVDPNNTEFVLKRLAHLISLLAGGTVSKGILDNYPVTIDRKEVTLRYERVNRLLGMEYSYEQIERSLRTLGFEVFFNSDNKTWLVKIPTYRPDVEREVDLIEEIGRIISYELIPSKLPEIKSFGDKRDDYQRFRYKCRSLMTSAGFNELLPLSLIDPDEVKNLGLDETHMWHERRVELLRPLSKDISVLRPSLLMTTMKTLGYNFSHQQTNAKLFETGVSFMEENDRFQERETLSIVFTGKINKEDYKDKRMVDFLTFKGVLEELLWHLEIDDSVIKYQRLEAEDDFSDIIYSGQGARIMVDDDIIGVFGLLRNKVSASYGVDQQAYWAEIDLGKLYNAVHNYPRDWRSVLGTNFPASRKDFSVLVGRGKEIGHIIKQIKAIKNVEYVNIVDVYSGKNIKTGFTSITISVVFRAVDHTLSQEELDKNIMSVKEIFEKENLEIREG